MPNEVKSDATIFIQNEADILGTSNDGSTSPLATRLGQLSEISGFVQPTIPINERLEITTAGTAEQFASATVLSTIFFTAPTTNTGIVYVGTALVSPTNFHIELQPGEKSNPIAIDNVNRYYGDAAVSGEVIVVTGS